MASNFTKRLIKNHERIKLMVYDDGDGRPVIPGKVMIGHPTIGWGRCLDRKGITIWEANELFENDIIDAEIIVGNIFGIEVFREDPRRVAALVDMAFNLGEAGLGRFVRMIEAVKQRDWQEAARHAKESLWYGQVGERSKTIVEFLKGSEESKIKGGSMKRKLAVGLLLLFVIGCAGTQQPKDPFAYGAYGTMVSSMAARDIAMQFVTNLRTSKQVSDEKWAEINKLDDKFLEKYAFAAKLMSDYKKGIVAQSLVIIAQTEMQTALEELKKYYTNQIPADNKPLIK